MYKMQTLLTEDVAQRNFEPLQLIAHEWQAQSGPRGSQATRSIRS